MAKYLALLTLLLASPAYAQSAARIPGKIVLSQELAEAVYQRLSQDPYASVAQLLARMQSEVAPQLAPVPPQEPQKEAPNALKK